MISSFNSNLQVRSGCWSTGSTPPTPPPTNNGTTPPEGSIEFSYNPQDKLVMQPGTTYVGGVGSGPSVEKAKVSGTTAAVDGKYVYDTKDSRWLAANTLAAVSKAINTFEGAYGSSVSWAFGSPQLTINPDKGDMLNAYYQRQSGSLNFFHSTDKVTKETVFSGASGEVVAHEAGHAILDGIRPGYLSSWSPDPGGFHESFGDVLAMLVGLKDERVLDRVVEQTGGDLSKPSVASDLGEELGVTINHASGGNATGGDFTRTAINDFTWQDPKTLPANAPYNKLSREVHSYSRLWTGAVYDVLKGITDENLKAGQSPKQAISGAADDLLKLYGGMMKIAPAGNFAYKEMAQALVKASESVGHTDLISKVFSDRKILTTEAGLDEWAPPTGATQTVETTLDGPDFGAFNGARVSTVVDASSSFVADEAADQLKSDLKTLIGDGRIRSTNMPGEKLTEKDYFDANGEPYVGVARYDLDGSLVIERSPVLT